MLLKDKLLDEEALEAQRRSELSQEQRIGNLEQGLDNLTTRYVRLGSIIDPSLYVILFDPNDIL